jgi:hypothetical protein
MAHGITWKWLTGVRTLGTLKSIWIIAIEVKFVKKVPQRVLDEQIERSKAELKYHRARLKELQAMEPGKVDLREQQRKRERRKRNKMYRERGLHHLIREE